MRDENIFLTSSTLPVPPLPPQLLVEALQASFQELVCEITREVRAKKHLTRLILRDFPLSLLLFLNILLTGSKHRVLSLQQSPGKKKPVFSVT